MRVARRIVSIGLDEPWYAPLVAAGVAFDVERREVAPGMEPMARLHATAVARVDEADPIWPRAEAILRAHGASDHVASVELSFDEPERAGAAWLHLRSVWHNGFPQPEDDWPEGSGTLDLSGRCPVCGVGVRQVGPYRLKRPPKWGRRWLMGLNWEPSALFARRDVWEGALAPLGAASREVLLHRDGSVLPGVVQLVPVEGLLLDPSGLRGELCGTCGQRRYAPPERSPYPRVVGAPEVALASATEWVGHGFALSHPVLASGAFYRAVRGVEGRTVEWHPCARWG